MAAKKMTSAGILITSIFLSLVACNDSTAPVVVPLASAFEAVAGDGAVSLSWSTPDNLVVTGTAIVRGTDFYPESLSDGTEVYRGSATSTIDTGLTNGTAYYYSVFTYDAAGNYSEAVTAMAKPFQQIVMIPIPAGSFQMGSDWENDPENPEAGQGLFVGEQPVHTVTLDGFLMSRTEITQAQFQAVVGTTYTYSGDDNLPDVGITLEEAASFCNSLSEREGFEPCYLSVSFPSLYNDYRKNGYRLPTEAEWEYACRAGTTTRYYSGDAESDLDRVGWYAVNSSGAIQPVGGKAANAWGLYDMHGNVAEWCIDWENAYGSEDQTNPTGLTNGTRTIIRGGSVFVAPALCRAAARSSIRPSTSMSGVGFRIVRRP